MPKTKAQKLPQDPIPVCTAWSMGSWTRQGAALCLSAGCQLSARSAPTMLVQGLLQPWLPLENTPKHRDKPQEPSPLPGAGGAVCYHAPMLQPGLFSEDQGRKFPGETHGILTCKVSVAPISGCGLGRQGVKLSSSAISLFFLVGLIVTCWSKNKNISKSVVLS